MFVVLQVRYLRHQGMTMETQFDDSHFLLALHQQPGLGSRCLAGFGAMLDWQQILGLATMAYMMTEPPVSKAGALVVGSY